MNNFVQNHKVLSESDIDYNLDDVSKTVHINTRKGKIVYFLTKDKWQFGNKNYKGTAEEFVKWYNRNINKE